MEVAPRRRTDGIGNLAGQQCPMAAVVGIGMRHRAQQRLRVGMQRRIVEGLGVCDLHQFAHVHDTDAIADVGHYIELVGHETNR